MSSIFHISFADDLYEISLRGHVIVRIMRYFNGSQQRQELTYDECPTAVQDKILDRVAAILASE